jgi:Na+/H+ antiporter NhaA
MMKIKQLIAFTFSLLLSSVAFGQDNTANVAGDDKINVVIGVLSVIFTCIIIYLVIIDRKITRLEKQRKQEKG